LLRSSSVARVLPQAIGAPREVAESARLIHAARRRFAIGERREGVNGFIFDSPRLGSFRSPQTCLHNARACAEND
jgi:hypothetical protein